VPGEDLYSVAGQTSASATFIAPSNANAAAFGVIAGGPNAGTNTYSVTVTEVFTGEVLASAADVTPTVGKLLRVGLTPACQVSGVLVTVRLTSGTFTASGKIGQIGWYLGPAVTAVVNSLDQPIFTEGPVASEFAPTPPGDNPITVDQIISGYQAADFTQGGIAPYGPDEIVQGWQGQGKSVQTVREPPQKVATGTVAVTNASTSVLLAEAASGTSIRLRRVVITTSDLTTAAEFTLLATSAGTQYGTGTVGVAASSGTPAIWEFDYEGLALPAADGLSLKNQGSAGHNYQWTITYDEY
jgi:hypothetical protein